MEPLERMVWEAATVRGLVTERRPRSGGLLKAVAVAMFLAALLAVALAGGRGSAAPVLPRLASPAGHGLEVRLPLSRTRVDNFCGSSGLVCTQVVVPLDRTGAVPGTVSLHVEELPADGVV